MTREEEIKIAASEYIRSYIYSTWEIWEEDIYDAFKDGANWADIHFNLRNLWYDASEEPKRDITSKLIYYIEDTNNISLCTLGKLLECYGEPDLSWNSVVKNLSITKWAYINDLLPKNI